MPRTVESVRLRERSIGAVEVPAEGFREVQDTEIPHLRLRVSSSGRRSWHYLAWHQKAARRAAIGAWPQVSLAMARQSARELDLRWSAGPGAELARRQGPRRSPTLGQLWTTYVQALAGRSRARSRAERESLWKLYLARWANEPAERITRARVAALHEEIGRSHQVTANRVLKVLRALWNWAEDRELVSGRNPAARIAMYRETPRDRFVLREEADRLLAALRDGRTPARMRHLVLLCLATGQRRGNVLAMRWADVDVAGAAWRIPAAAAKGGRTLEVPLLPLALEVLRERRAEVAPECAWVFPGRGVEGPWSEPKKGWAGLLARAGIGNLHLHDLRRTLGSWMAIGNASTTIIGRALGHASPASTAIYARLTSDPVAAAMQGALEAMGAAPETAAPPDPGEDRGGAKRPRKGQAGRTRK